MQWKKPRRLSPGDTVATVSLSWGGAGDRELRWRYALGKRRLEEQFGLRVVEMPHTLAGAEYLYRHPEARAADWMEALADPQIRGVFSCIGGEESIRLLPFLDWDCLRANPKVFLGYSDSTIAHLVCTKAGVTSFYGPSVLGEFAENVDMFSYTAAWFRRVLFCAEPPGEVPAAAEWTGERLAWTEENQHIRKRTQTNGGYEVLQGRGKARGRLLGGCLEVLEMAKGAEIWPDRSVWEGALLFFETSEDCPTPQNVAYELRNYAAQGILQRASGILWGKPLGERHKEAYRQALLQVIRDECGLTDLPVFYNMSFGHNQPMCCLPYGVTAELDCDRGTFTLLESGVQ